MPTLYGDKNHMKTDRWGKSEPGPSAMDTHLLTCSHCHQSFKSEFDLVRSGNNTLCIACYESLIEPFPRLCCDGAAF